MLGAVRASTFASGSIDTTQEKCKFRGKVADVVPAPATICGLYNRFYHLLCLYPLCREDFLVDVAGLQHKEAK